MSLYTIYRENNSIIFDLGIEKIILLEGIIEKELELENPFILGKRLSKGGIKTRNEEYEAMAIFYSQLPTSFFRIFRNTKSKNVQIKGIGTCKDKLVRNMDEIVDELGVKARKVPSKEYEEWIMRAYGNEEYSNQSREFSKICGENYEKILASCNYARLLSFPKKSIPQDDALRYSLKAYGFEISQSRIITRA